MSSILKLLDPCDGELFFGVIGRAALDLNLLMAIPHEQQMSAFAWYLPQPGHNMFDIIALNYYQQDYIV
jgi:hypothetical protein